MKTLSYITEGMYIAGAGLLFLILIIPLMAGAFLYSIAESRFE